MRTLITYIVDDDDIYQFMASRTIKMTNMVNAIKTFPNGKSAVDYILTHSEDSETLPDVIFLDINMPIMNGWEFLEEFNRIKSLLKKDIKVCMVSSSIDEVDIRRAEENENVYKFMSKPVKQQKFQEVLSEFVLN